jgi:O-acetyl-ADP-ribose deacetylase (regulator of RNase III)
MTKIELVKGDITKLNVDAIVNAANTSLLGGGGVDGAIHRAAGSELLEECRTLNGCLVGEAKITKGYKLPAKHVIHTVGPIWRGGTQEEKEVLKRAYIHSLKLALENQLKTIAFPNISTGVYRFPKDIAADIAIATVKEFTRINPGIDKVIFCAFDEKNYQIYKEELDKDVDNIMLHR